MPGCTRTLALREWKVMQTIPVCEYAGYPIVLLLPAGIFMAEVEDTQVKAQSLDDLRERLTKMKTKMQLQQRKEQESVRVFALYQDSNGKHYGAYFDIQGVVAGRRYASMVRTKQGQIESLNAGSLRVLAMNDCRIATVRCMMAECEKALGVYKARQEAYKLFVDSLPSVPVPRASSKEDALDVEPAFLQALRDVPSVERDRPYSENIEVPA